MISFTRRYLTLLPQNQANGREIIKKMKALNTILKILEKILTSNHFGLHLISIFGWIFLLWSFGIKGLLKGDELRYAFMVKQYTLIMSLFLIWNTATELFDILSGKMRTAVRIYIYVIPVVCAFFLVYLGIFTERYTLVPERHSIVTFVPIIYLTLLFKELILRVKVGSEKRKLFVFLYTVLNCYICLRVNVAWFAWFRGLGV
ncbi:hypothetical protein [Sedimentisphaera salicampi]|uniref:hypothetical protein n=1 Tax=Sedimentisphaera salicampi TaxID=1941349 RepID=UPI000B9CF5A7|nr:hypothetical protein [Sedimentisphaera salicampi]OXU14832.1 hypothetical protein SMSP1_01327 [Sedimentisphaera salicampi]